MLNRARLFSLVSSLIRRRSLAYCSRYETLVCHYWRSIMLNYTERTWKKENDQEGTNYVYTEGHYYTCTGSNCISTTNDPPEEANHWRWGRSTGLAQWRDTLA